MNRFHIFSKKYRFTSVMIIFMVLFFAVGKPIFASSMMNPLSSGMHQEDMATMGEFHLLLADGPKVMADADMPDGGSTMICCIEGSESFPIPANSFLRSVLESGFVSANPSVADIVSKLCPDYIQDSPSSRDITLLSQCQRE